jgi:hypothetical protein
MHRKRRPNRGLEVRSTSSALPGARPLAYGIERRTFLRRSSRTIFGGLVATSLGAVSLGTFLASPASAQQGPGCPVGCGPAPCCDTGACDKPCCAGGQGQSGECVNNGAKCLGADFGTWPDPSPANGANQNCWNSAASGKNTRCCDCRTNNQNGCAYPGPNPANRCICHRPV